MINAIRFYLLSSLLIFPLVVYKLGAYSAQREGVRHTLSSWKIYGVGGFSLVDIVVLSGLLVAFIQYLRRSDKEIVISKVALKDPVIITALLLGIYSFKKLCSLMGGNLFDYRVTIFITSAVEWGAILFASIVAIEGMVRMLLKKNGPPLFFSAKNCAYAWIVLGCSWRGFKYYSEYFLVAAVVVALVCILPAIADEEGKPKDMSR